MPYQFAIVVSEFNLSISNALLAGTLKRLSERGIAKEQIVIKKVPGAIEISLIAQLFAQQKKFSAIICLGAVIRGDTNHYDYVCQQVSYGCQKVMLDFNIPVIFGILTTNTYLQAEERIGGSQGHKGIEAADAALEMAKIVKDMSL